MKTKDPYGNEILDLYHLAPEVKAEIVEWIDEHDEYIKSGYDAKNLTKDEVKGYEMALRHLKFELTQVKEYI